MCRTHPVLVSEEAKKLKERWPLLDYLRQQKWTAQPTCPSSSELIRRRPTQRTNGAHFARMPENRIGSTESFGSFRKRVAPVYGACGSGWERWIYAALQRIDTNEWRVGDLVAYRTRRRGDYLHGDQNVPHPATVGSTWVPTSKRRA